MKHLQKETSLLIFGTGWLGKPLALHLLKSEYTQLSATYRNRKDPQLAAELLDNYFPFDINSNKKDILTNYFTKKNTFIFTIPPKTTENHPIPFHKKLEEFLDRLPPNAKFIFCSTTSVYPNTHSIHFESDILETNSFLLSEQAVQQRYPDALILRLGGLMGQKRALINFYKENKISDADTKVNYIHQTDVIRAIKFLMDIDAIGIYNLCAPKHPTKGEVLNAQLSLLNKNKMYEECSLNKENRIISSQKILDQGFTFEYENPCTFPFEFT